MFIQTYMIVIACIIFVTTMFGTYTIFKRLQSLQSAMDDLGKSRAISYDAIARLDELESTINTLAEGLEEMRESLEKAHRTSRNALGQVDPLRRNLQELQVALAHANTRRSKGRFDPNA